MLKIHILKRWKFDPKNPVKTFELIFSADYYKELQKLLHIAKVEGFDLVRTGCKHDGGYIMLDDLHAGDTAYSLGIGTECLVGQRYGFTGL